MKPADWWLPAAQQRAFRAVLDGFARPGSRVPAGPQGGVLTFLSTVLDESVTLADPQGLLAPDDRRLLLAPAAALAEARFVLMDGATALGADCAPALGTLESPELGATLVLVVAALHDGAAPRDALPLMLQGPGIAGSRPLAVSGLAKQWLAHRRDWVSAFPLGVDLVLAAPDALVALPRSTRIHLPEA
jgi:alpha-D-ribose 1-methylphosphonate 5-triphosphate synthase subunit PhnH